jgi:alpha,alpha-trehalose phosphorylase
VSRFRVRPWSVVEERLDLDALGWSESVLALSNGHIGLRGTLEEGEPVQIPGSYLNGFYETRPLPYAESAYGYPEAGETLVNVTDGKVIRLLVDDEPFDVRYGTLRSHERELDLRDGVLRREADWVSPAGKRVRVRSARLVSFVQRAIAAIRYEVEPVGEGMRIVVQSELVPNETMHTDEQDPRAAAALREPLSPEFSGHHELRAVMVHRTRSSGLRIAAAMDHELDGVKGITIEVESEPDLARATFSTELDAGQTLTLTKLVAYGWSSRRSRSALRDQVVGALAEAKRSGWEELCRCQREYLEEFWQRADVEIDGDEALQQALRFALFQVLQASARAEQRAIPAKGLTGPGYDGHTFWDMETYTLPVLTYVLPHAARDALRWRHDTLEQAEQRARVLGLRGATFPWRTISGQECSGYWPASTAAFHINADIADAVRRYVLATGDGDFARGPGIELLVATARLWRSLGHHDAEGIFRIDGVTGPDEYTALVDNNVYTNLMAARNLEAAAEACVRHPDRAEELDVDSEEMASWRDAAAAVAVPHDPELDITPQCDGFTRLRDWDWESTKPRQYPLLMHFHNYMLYSSQVVKQADLVMALYLCGDRFPPELKRRDFDFYERITVRDSSLSAAIQAIVAAEVGHLELAQELFSETALTDLRDLAANTEQGIHLAAAAGTWLAVVAGFGGLRDHGERLSFAPALPPRLRRVSFGILQREGRLRVTITQQQAEYALEGEQPLELLHHGEPATVAPGEPLTLELPERQRFPAPPQPPGRETGRRHRRS